MSKANRLWIGLALSVAALGVLGGWSRLRLGRSAAGLRAAESQLAEMRTIVREHGLALRQPGSAQPEAIGAVVERAASEARLSADSVREVRAVQGAGSGVKGSLPAYSMQLKEVAAEPLVRFIYLLESEAGFRAVELEMTRDGGQTRHWNVSLVVVQVP
jgi:hypothetical protein